MCWKCILLNTQLYIRDFRRLSYHPYHSSSHRTVLFTRERALPIESRLLKPTPTSACTIPPSKSYINDAELQCSIRMKCLWWMRRRSVNICSEQDEMNKESHHHWQLSDATKFAPTKSYTHSSEDLRLSFSWVWFRGCLFGSNRVAHVVCELFPAEGGWDLCVFIVGQSYIGLWKL